MYCCYFVKKYCLIISLLLVVGCTQEFTQSNEAIMSINNYFNDEISIFYQEMVDTALTCRSGQCPTLEVDETVNVIQCFFCDSNSSGIQGDDLRLNIGIRGGADTFAGCTLKSDEHEIAGSFEIINITDNVIKARVITTGEREAINCDQDYDYNYSTTWIWTFRDETELDLSVSTTALKEYPQAGDVPCLEYCNTQPHEECDGFTWNITGEPPAGCNCSYLCGAGGPEGEYVIRLPGSKSGQIVSNETITVTCSHPELQNPSAYLVLKEVNGVPQTPRKIDSYPIGIRVKESTPNSTVYQLYSFWDANYTVSGACSSYADNLDEIDGTEIKVIVTGSLNGLLPRDRY